MSGYKLCIVASGSGTDFEAIAKAWKAGQIPEVAEIFLVSTKEDAGCLEKAAALSVPSLIVPKKGRSEEEFMAEMWRIFTRVDFIFLAGCIHRVPTGHELPPIFNIHPADTHDFGGDGMYGLTVHKRVLSHVIDLIKRGRATLDDVFITEPTVHRVTSGYDQGAPIMKIQVPIPADIISWLYSGDYDLEAAAAELQKHVLRFEWLILPTAIRQIAMMIDK